MRKLTWSETFQLLKTTIIEFFQENSGLHGAALAYYTMVALVPILYIAIEIFGIIVGQETMITIISDVMRDKIGIKDMSGISVFLNQIDFTKGSFVLRIIGVIALLISSTALLSSLKTSLNEFFDISSAQKSRKRIIKDTIKSKTTSILLLGFFGIVIIVTYFAQTVLISAGDSLFSNQNGVQWFLAFLVQNVGTILTSTIMFAGVFKFLHDGVVEWKLAWAGGLVTSTLLFVGQILIKYYLMHLFFAKNGGVAGTMLIILAWMFYTSQIIFFGAKFTAVFGRMIGKPIAPKK
jgi:membrane protein